MIFGALLVSSKERQYNPDQWRPIENSRPYLDLAADALRHLDSGNSVIERCVEYLTQLSMILKATSKIQILFMPGLGRPCLLIDDTASDETTSLNNFANMQVPFNAPPIFPADHINDPVWSNVDLGEFMTDNDLDFLGRMFNFNHSHDSTI